MKFFSLIILGIAVSLSLPVYPHLVPTYAEPSSCIIVDRYLPCIDSKYVSPFETDSNFTLAKLNWSQASFPINNGTGFVSVSLQDPDLNTKSDFKESANVFVLSDSETEIHVIKLQETEDNSGIFERKFGISSFRSAPSVILAHQGDTITAMYIDLTMPPGYHASESHLISHAIIGSSGPPLERVMVSNAQIKDITLQNAKYSPKIDEQILLTTELTLNENHPQSFVWISQISDKNGHIMSLSWIEGTMNPMTSFNPTTSWIPKQQGTYDAVFFVWESLTNPSALSPPIELEFTVSD